MREHKAMIRTNLFLSEAQRDALKKVSKQKRITAAEVLRQILDHALGTTPKPVELNLPVLDLKK